MREVPSEGWFCGGLLISSDGGLVMGANDFERSVEMISFEKQNKIPRPPTSSRPSRLAIALGGESFGVIDGSSIRVWRTEDGLPLHHFTLSIGTLFEFAYSSDGKKLVALGSGGLEILDANSGQSHLQVK